MKVFTYSEARQKLASLLDEAERSGRAIIRRRDGSTYAVVPERSGRSPLDVPGIDCDITTDEILECIREGRDRGSEGAH